MLKGFIRFGLVVGAAVGLTYAVERVALARVDRNPDPDPGWRPTPLEGVVSRISTADGTTLRAVAAGEGPPIVLLHGLMVSSDVWSRVFGELVAASHRVIAYDMRGHGGSGVGSDGIGMSHLGDDMVAVLEHFELQGAVIVGHSMGAMVAMNFILDHPDVASERVAGLVLSSTAAGGVFDVPQNKAQLLLLKTGVVPKLIRHPIHGPLLARGYFGEKPSGSMVRALNAMHAATDPETITTAPLAMVDFDLRDRLEGIKIPTLVIHGAEDSATPPAAGALIADRVPGARFRLLEGVSHMVPWEAADELIGTIVDFSKERRIAAG